MSFRGLERILAALSLSLLIAISGCAITVDPFHPEGSDQDKKEQKNKEKEDEEGSSGSLLGLDDPFPPPTPGTERPVDRMTLLFLGITGIAFFFAVLLGARRNIIYRNRTIPPTRTRASTAVRGIPFVEPSAPAKPPRARRARKPASLPLVRFSEIRS